MKRWLWIGVLVIALVAVGCSGSAPEPAAPSTGSGETFQFALPRLVIDIDSQGAPSVLGIGPGLLRAFGVDVSQFGLPQETVVQLMASNIQNIEVAMAADGFHVLVNGKPMPIVSFTPDSLRQAVQLGAVFGGQNMEILERILPVVARLGLDLALRFPAPAGTAEIPLPAPGAAHSFRTSPSSEPPSLFVRAEILFDEEGIPSIMGVSGKDLEEWGLGSAPALSPDLIANLQQNNIQHVEVRNHSQGFYVFVNGEPLPSVTWDSSTLANLTELYGQINPDNPLLPVIQAFLPYLDRGDVQVLLHFPLAPGAEPIPVQMHE